MQKIKLVSDIILLISSLNPRYHPNESPELKRQHCNIFVLLFKAAKNNNAENLKCVKHVNTIIVSAKVFILISHKRRPVYLSHDL